MGRVCVLVMLNILLWLGADAQIFKKNSLWDLEPTYLTVSEDKTLNLIFPYAIKAIDRGIKELLVQKALNTENVLQVKAANSDLKETNLTVITSSGTLYSFLFSYARQPDVLNFVLDEINYPISEIVKLEAGAAEGGIAQIAKDIALKNRDFFGKRDKKYDVTLTLKGLYFKDDLFYVQLEIENRSNISYSLDQLRIYIQDRRSAKRTVSQEIELQPVHIESGFSYVAPNSAQTAVYVLDKFNIPDRKLLHIQAMEKNGGRHLNLKLKNKHLLKGVRL